MPVYDYVTLNTGDKMPVFGLGTWKSQPGQVEHAVEYALKTAGYRHIDTAAAYGNEVEVGQGIKASGIKREDIFLTTKLDNSGHGDPEEALRSSLQNLDTPYLDLWLMHWPAPMTDGKPNKNIDWVDTWKAMVNVKKLNPDKVKAIGVSNVSVEYLTRLLENTDYVPAVNQIELHPSCPQADIRKLCKEKGIVVTAYSPLGSDNSPLLTNEVVSKIAERHNVHPANILISIWANMENTTVISKSVTNSRIESNKKLVNLSDEEIEELLKISEKQHFRACNPEWTGWGDLGFPDRKGIKKD